MRAQFGEREVEFDVQKALESYRRIRAGSLRGAAVTRALTDLAKQALGPDWRRRVKQTVEHGEDERAAEEAERANH
jgi:hypothetical protein